MTYGLDGLTSGVLVTIKTERHSKDANLFQQPIPGTDSSSAIQLDLFGASRTITLDGVFVNGTASKSIAQFIAELDALINGTQSTTKTFTSDKSGTTYEVLVQSTSWTSEEADVNSVNYSITLVESA